MELSWTVWGFLVAVPFALGLVLGFVLGTNFGYGRGKRDETRSRIHDLDPLYRAYRSAETEPLGEHLKRLEHVVEELKEDREARAEAALKLPATYRSY